MNPMHTTPELALVLAAGRGSRMKDLTTKTPKHMLPVAGKPVLEHIITRLRDAGIARIVIVTGYLGEMIEDYFGDGSGFDVRISYVRQTNLDGTGSAVLIAHEAVGRNSFLVTFGDLLASSSAYRGLLDDYNSLPCDALIALNWVDDPYSGAAVYLDDSDRIIQIVEKPPVGKSTTQWNQSGIFVFSPIIFDYLSRIELSPRGEYELTDAVMSMLAGGRCIRGYKMSGIWCDVGRPDDIARAGRLLEEE